MPYDAKAFNVLIASPGDVGPERAIVRDVVYEWNNVNSSTRKAVLLPVGWETHSSPDMSGPPQTIINKQIVDDCDLLVGIFWTRLGTPTASHPSGTVEEIEQIIALGRPVMLYFSSTPVALDSVDQQEYARLKEFRDSCKPRGLYEAYTSLSDFREKLYRHLQLKVNSHPLFQKASTTTPEELQLSKFQLPKLSREAQAILTSAASADDGAIYFMRYLGGSELQVGGLNLMTNQDRREIAKWEAALQELLQHGYVVARGGKGEFFELTNSGFQAAEILEA